MSMRLRAMAVVAESDEARFLRDVPARIDVSVASSLADALSRLPEQRPDVVILDLDLPDSRGFETAARMLRAAPNAPIVVLADVNDEDAAIRAVQAGAQSYFLKEQVTGNLLVQAARCAVERKRAEHVSRESARRLKTLLANLPGMAYRCRNDPSWTMEFLSEGCERLTGHPPEDFIADRRLSYADLIHPNDGERVWKEVQSALTERRPFELEYRIRSADGRERWVWEQGVGVFSSAGEVLALEGYITDVTQRRQAEEALRKSEARYRVMVETRPEAVCRWLPDTTLTFVNETYCRLFEADKNECVGRSWLDFVPRAERDDLRESCARMAREPRVYSNERQVIDARGEMRWLHWIDAPILDGAGRLVEFQSIGHDVTDRKLAEEALRESEEKYRRVSENIPVVVYSALPDEHSTNLLVTGRVQEQTGYTSDEFLRDPTLWKNILCPGDRERVFQALAAHRREGSLLDVEYRILTRSGEERWIRDRAVPAFDEDGRVARIDGFMEDVTERKQLEEQLRQSQKMEAIGRLAGGVAHDFNNLLGVITGYTETARKTLALGHPARSRLDQLMSAVDKAVTLTRQLLAFSRRQSLKPRVVGLNSIVREIQNLLRRLIGEDVELRVETAAARDAVCVDPAQIEQVLLNLSVNARDAMRRGGVLTISTRLENVVEAQAWWGAPIRPGAYVVLDVRDNGCGMDEETRSRLFEPFFTTKPEGKGTGLGLAIVYGIVRQSEGYIDVETWKGEGTTFRIYLPLSDAERPDEPVRAERTRPAEDLRGTETVLVVEDEEALRDIVAESLQEYGYSVITASHGDDALELARRFQGEIALLVTDVVMPLISGRELADRLSAAHPRLRVLFMSGYTDDVEALQELIERGVAFLEKPFSGRILAERAREALDSPPYASITAPPRD